MVLGKLEEIRDLRKVWTHEALDFTPWLAEEDNMALLSDAIGIDITVDETESAVGNFSVDIAATETGTDRKIIIENQLEDTNHDHLGKIITYAAGKNADIIIWVVKHAREEHRAAIEWLNAHTDDEICFFLCEIKLYRISGSVPAVKFNVVEKPNDWTREIKKSEVINDTQQSRYDYWVEFEDYAFARKLFQQHFSKRKPSYNHWMNFSIGSSSCHLGVTQVRTTGELGVELYINEDKELFADLYKQKQTIENESELKYDWREMPDRKSSRIVIKKSVDFTDKEDWKNQFEWLMDVMVRMKKVFKKYI